MLVKLYGNEQHHMHKSKVLALFTIQFTIIIRIVTIIYGLPSFCLILKNISINIILIKMLMEEDMHWVI